MNPEDIDYIQDMVKVYISRGVDIEAWYNEGWTALNHALDADNSPGFRTSVEHGADTNVQSNENKSILMPAIGQNDHEMLSHLLTYASIEMISCMDHRVRGMLHHAGHRGKRWDPHTLLGHGTELRELVESFHCLLNELKDLSNRRRMSNYNFKGLATTEAVAEASDEDEEFLSCKDKQEAFDRDNVPAVDAGSQNEETAREEAYTRSK
ncbi:uncharacterized protein KY384_000053 [Bacidia gigantensis]|uniref:uncharacterized protein n=1 Tax=Bacidia gigantensis TaxID=2732470 RepID=UPI001D045AD9|nr:uncharacterized protein KY384_000053 [Bacidia gigantensis]KAG8526460.1 hypothetical protein KY384_000053 [Bacidia gigantensis]